MASANNAETSINLILEHCFVFSEAAIELVTINSSIALLFSFSIALPDNTP